MEARFIEASEVGGDCRTLQVEGEVKSGEDLAYAENAVEVDRANLGELKGFLNGTHDKIVIPGGAIVGADSEEESLRSASFWAFIVKRYGGTLVGAGDALRPLVKEKSGVWSLCRWIALCDAGESDATLIRWIAGVDRKAQPAVAGLQW
jgi:hypothetical protein